MKRIITLLLAAVILFSLTLTVYADTESSITLSTRVYSAPTWNLQIPASTYIPFRQTSTEIGQVFVYNVYNPDGAPGYIDVYLTYSDMRNDDYSDYLRLGIYGEFEDNYNTTQSNPWLSGETYKYYRNNDENYSLYDHAASFNDGMFSMAPTVTLKAVIDENEWNNARPGSYSTTLTFRSEMTFTDH